jgi:hypothetical protein
MVNVMSQSMTCPNTFVLGIDNVRSKLDVPVPVFEKNSRIEYRVWCTPQQVILSPIIESWFQQNILPKNNSVDLYQKGSFMAGFGPTV